MPQTIISYLLKRYGIGEARAKQVCKYLGINAKANTRKLNTVIRNRVLKYVMSTYAVDGRLKKKTYFDIRKKVHAKTYQGRRLWNRLPARGQRTRTNAKTQKRIIRHYGKNKTRA